jgi:hypothetical protein
MISLALQAYKSTFSKPSTLMVVGTPPAQFTNLLICDANGKEIVNRNLVVKDIDDSTLVYYKKNKRRKKKTENNENSIPRPPAFFT